MKAARPSFQTIGSPIVFKPVPILPAIRIAPASLRAFRRADVVPSTMSSADKPLLDTLLALESDAWHRAARNDAAWYRQTYLTPDTRGFMILPGMGIVGMPDILAFFESNAGKPSERAREHKFSNARVVGEGLSSDTAALVYRAEFRWTDAEGKSEAGEWDAVDCSTVFVNVGGKGDWRCVSHQQTLVARDGK
ncbi:hypothetical protein DFJ74DRAFT_674076 [Hyaloraphidium curvatum]|nr:hypothetical protein DFJ74DRAFT_674076 [Hyaloraphidium curvatum]